MVALRSVYRSAWSRSYRVAAVNQQLLRHYSAARNLFNFSSPPTSTSSPNGLASFGILSSLQLSLWIHSSSFSYKVLFRHKSIIFSPYFVMLLKSFHLNSLNLLFLLRFELFAPCMFDYMPEWSIWHESSFFDSESFYFIFLKQLKWDRF